MLAQAKARSADLGIDCALGDLEDQGFIAPCKAEVLTSILAMDEMDQLESAFANISNLWNTNGPLTGGWTGSPGLLYPVPNYANVIGRYFTVGVRVNM